MYSTLLVILLLQLYNNSHTEGLIVTCPAANGLANKCELETLAWE